MALRGDRYFNINRYTFIRMEEMECTEWALHDPPPRFVSVTKRRDREKEENFPGKYPRAHTD